MMWEWPENEGSILLVAGNIKEVKEKRDQEKWQSTKIDLVFKWHTAEKSEQENGDLRLPAAEIVEKAYYYRLRRRLRKQTARL
jgi:hypothetical protein